MFMAADRQPKMRAMIMARTETERRAALAELLPLQQADFEGLFAAMPGRPVTIRLLDPPLHEFLPDRVQLAQRVQKARDEGAVELAALEQELELVQRIGEVNPMLGTRGCRLGIVHPEIYEMQIEAIMLAAPAAAEPPKLEIMIPLVDFEGELHELRAMVVRIGEDTGCARATDYIVGTMIELPRACFVADRLATEAAFFSFGTNDLTQTALGFSRDDVEAGFVGEYLERRILDRSPFESVDVAGVGALVEIAAQARARAAQGHRARRLRRARRRPGLDRVLPPRGPGLRLVLALPAADRPRRRGAGRAGGLMSRISSPADVRDHRSGPGRRSPSGVEEEYMLLDPETFDLVPRAEEILQAEAGGEFAEQSRPSCSNRWSSSTRRSARRGGRRREAAPDAPARGRDGRGAGPVARLGGNPPVQPVRAPEHHAPRPLQALIDQLQYAGRRELIYGLHVHVAVADPDRAIGIVNALRAHLCELVALSASSPFWRGQPTGFASSRHLIFAAFPRSGPPPEFDSYDEYASVIEQIVEAGAIEDYTRIWWDVRPHPHFGTVEVRVMDAVPRVEDAIALAAYVQALVAPLRGGAGRAPASGDRAREQVARVALRARGHDGRRRAGRRRSRALIARTLEAARAATRATSAASASSRASSGSCVTATARSASCASTPRAATSAP